MLRRKLLINLGPLVALMLFSAVLAIWLLQGVLEKLDQVTVRSWQSSTHVTELAALSHRVEGNLYELLLGGIRREDRITDTTDALRQLAQLTQSSELCCEEQAHPLCLRVREIVPRLQGQIWEIREPSDLDTFHSRVESALADATTLRQTVVQLNDAVRELHRGEEEAVVASFRRIVIGLALSFLLVINLAVVILMRLGQMILRPVDKLLEATRALAHGQYSTRIALDEGDEFDELAQAYNELAERLQSNEKRQLEVLGQVALAMNHEINNAIAIIELQLRLLSRRQTPGAEPQKYLQEIHQSLQRMTQAVQALKSVQRIVLTDYLPGVKMLDLERSQQPDEQGRPTQLSGA